MNEIKKVMWWINSDDSATLYINHKLKEFEKKPRDEFAAFLEGFVERAKMDDVGVDVDVKKVDWHALAEELFAQSLKLGAKGEMGTDKKEQ